MLIETKAGYIIGAISAAAAGIAAPALVPIDHASENSLVHIVLHHALGLEITLPVFVAGAMFAIAGGFVAMAATPPEGRLDRVMTLIAALLIGSAFAMIRPAIPLVSNLPVQVVMLVGGMSSRQAVEWGRGLSPGLWFGKKGA